MALDEVVASNDPETEAGGEPDAEEQEDEEDLIDPIEAIKEKCMESKNTQELQKKLDECTARVTSRKKTEEDCSEELQDFVHAMDHCTSKTLFSKLV